VASVVARLPRMPERNASSLRRSTAVALAVVALTVSSCAQLGAQLGSSSTKSSAPNAAERQIIDAVNRFRGANGLRALSVQSNLEEKAHLWAAWMAGGGCGRSANGVPMICHSDVTSGITVRWTLLEENVGAISPATNIAGLVSRFESSPEHVANMLNTSITSIGVGVAYSGNTSFVAEEFMAP
jgi:uncharacterized protein YkwD